MTRATSLKKYKTNKQVYDSIKDVIPIAFKDAESYWKEVFSMLLTYLLNGNSLILPYKLGVLTLEKKPDSRNEMIDYGATNKARKLVHPDWTNEDWKKLPYEERLLVRFTNSHSDGYIYKLMWFRDELRGTIKNISFFKFIANRHKFLRKLAKDIQNGDAPNVVNTKYKTK